MNGQHLRAFLWLRWRLRINQLRRGGIANFVILTILAILAGFAAVGLFFAFLGIGSFALDDASPAVLMYVLDGAVVAFLFLWMTGLIQELQRSEPLSLDKFLHLPVSLSSAFFINYLSSLASVVLVWFLSAMLGLILGLLFSRGWAMLFLLPMLAAFLFMVTALTYQFQGWLATLMANPRRRRTIIVTVTMLFIVLSQAPNLLNMWRFRGGPPKQVLPIRLERERQELLNDEQTNKIPYQEARKRERDIEKREADVNRVVQAELEKANAENTRQLETVVRVTNLILPPGWLALGMEATAEGQALPILLAIVGPALIGTASLWRAYRTTMSLYTGQYTSGRTAPSPAQSVSEGERQPSQTLRNGMSRTSLLERKLPWLSEQASVVALASFRSLLRAPEAKMFLLTPLIMMVCLGPAFMAVSGRDDVPELLGPLFAFGATTLIMFGLSQLLANQFGFDRDGFRAFVLSPVRRRDILLGKNLAVAPLALTLGAIVAVVVQVVFPMRWDHFLALVPRCVSMYLLYCLPANVLSILAPMRISAGSFQPARPRGIVILSQLIFMFLCPPVLGLTLIPLGVEWVAEAMDWRYGIPIDLLLSVLECAVIVFVYGLLLRLQGDWLQAREQKILQIVTTRAN